ncbi:MAG TPA: conjugal transfer protein, partial [Actinomycetota bacterium]
TDARNARLGAFLAASADPSAGWDGRGVQEAGNVVPVGLSVVGPRNAVATVAARAGARWLYLAVPILVQPDRIVVSDLPAFVPGPWPSAAVEGSPISSDPSQTGDIRPALESFFRAYAGGSQGDLSYFAAPGRSLKGLGGSMDFGGLVELRTGEGTSTVPAEARVRWVDKATGAGLTQTYRMTLVARDGRWYVDRLGAGPALSKEAAS